MDLVGERSTGSAEALSSSQTLQELAGGNHEPAVLKTALGLRGEDQEALFAQARAARDQAFPEKLVEVRSVMEISNVCSQGCHYCSMAKGSGLKRYVVKTPALLEIAKHLYATGRRVMLLQSGENSSPRFVEHCCELVAELSSRYPDLEQILCLGNLTRDQYKALRDAGASRYVLKFESSNPDLYHQSKPTDTTDKRTRCLEDLLELGYHVGTGNIVGLPGQTIDDLVGDLLFLGRYKCAMSSTTVFVPGEDCGYVNEPAGDIDTTFNFMALIRILYPDRLIPTTSCLEKLRTGGQLIGLMAGANTVTIHDATPEQFRELFPIYSTERCTPNANHLLHAAVDAGLAPSTTGGLVHPNYR